MSWADMPIDESFIPGADWLWAFERLHDPAQGVLKQAMDSMDVTLVPYKKPEDDFLVEEVCGPLQCDHGAGCLLSKDSFGGFQHACDCSIVGDAKNLPVTLGCKIANNGRMYENKLAAKIASCTMKTFLMFKDFCWDQSNNPCKDVSCPQDGSICIAKDGVASCECLTCPNEFNPVCGSNDRTYRSECEMHRENCMYSTNHIVKSQGMCTSQCDEVDCRDGQCVELPQGSATCVCPTVCIDVHSPVCGSDGNTYDNECRLTIAACEKETPITVVGRKPCDELDTMATTIAPVIPHLEGSGEGSGDGGDECGCRYGATCDATVDDEDRSCVCDFTCGSSGPEVCGSDGITYVNECEMNKAQCEMQKMIWVTRKGACINSCKTSKYGCCGDGVTPASGVGKGGCPESCKCNEHGSFSQTCHSSTGQCNCRPGVGGLKCDQCQPGFWNFHAMADKGYMGCMACKCHKDGSLRDDCDQMTGQCVCKKGVVGVKCVKCADTGDYVSPAGCGVTASSGTASSCSELNCRYGQECVADESGNGFICQCPSLSSCDGYSNGKVCGSNGITYADECQMKVVACRAGIVITVQAEGTCKAYVKSLKPVIPPTVKPTPTVTTTRSTTTKKTTVTPSMTTATTTQKPEVVKPPSTTSMYGENADANEGGSGEDNSNRETTIDDEDNEEGSGNEVIIPPMVPGTYQPPGNVITPVGPGRPYKVTAHLISGDNIDFVFSPDLKSKQSELYVEYSASIGYKIMMILNMMPARGRSPPSIQNIEMEESDSKGITVTFDFMLPNNVSPEEISDFISANLNEGESFTIDTPVNRPPIGPNLPYIEGGEWNVPQFGGSSYMEFEKMTAYSAATIHMRFKTSDSEGLLLYNGQESKVDFISLAVIGGYVEFRFDTGSGQLSLRSRVPVNDGKWHEVVSRRNRREGMLMVDNESEISGNSNSGTTGLNLDTGLFIGGVDHLKQDIVLKHTGVKKGLTGCISEVKVGEHGGETLGISSADDDAVHTHRIAECSSSPCLPSPCMNSAKCFITYQLEEYTYKCDCSSGFFGEKCEHKTTLDACASNPCHESSTCHEEENSYSCICPQSRTGVHCESLIEDLKLPTVMEPSYMPVFAGDSYIQRPSLVEVKLQLEVEVIFYTFHNEGLLFYNGQKENGQGDFVALNIREGYLEFMYNLGESTAIIKSNKMVTTNQWHTVKLSRYGRLGDLKLDDGPILKGESPREHSQLNLGQPLYIGGFPESVSVPREITTGLMGSIQKFVVNGVTFSRSLITEDSKSFNVNAFNGHACFRKPCQNDGTCIPDLGSFSCSCKTGFSGEHCDAVDDTEVPMLQDSAERAIYFNGNVKALYNNHVTRKDNSFKDNYFEIQIKTTAVHGLIFYDGKASKRGDYIALALNHGRIHLAFDLGSGSANIVSDTLVNNGQWRTIKIIRNEHKASLQIDDDKPKRATAPPLTKWLNTMGTLWIGGCAAEHMPPRHRGLPRSFYVGFEGCLRQFHVTGTVLRLREDVLNTPNLATCQDR